MLTVRPERREDHHAVAGHATYYPRFGFARADACGIRAPWEYEKLGLASPQDAMRFFEGFFRQPTRPTTSDRPPAW